MEAAAPDPAPPIVHAIAGSIGSALAVLLFYPLQRARIELQAQAAHSQQHGIDLSDDLPTQNESLGETTAQLYASDAGDETIEEEKVRSFPSAGGDSEASTSPQWKIYQPATRPRRTGLIECLGQLNEKGELYTGMMPVVTTMFTSQFVFFFMHAYVKHVVRYTPFSERFKGPAPSNAVLSLVSSCLAGIGNVILTNPLWVVNMAIVTGEAESNNLWKELIAMAKSRGLRHLWDGTYASLLLVSNPVIQFFTYEQIKYTRLEAAAALAKANAGEVAAPIRPRTTLTAREAFLAGALSKAVATISTYPLQLTQTLMRLKDSGYSGIGDCLIKLFKRGGFPEWFRGMRAKLFQTILNAAFTFLTYEEILTVVQKVLVRSSKKNIKRPPPPSHRRRRR